MIREGKKTLHAYQYIFMWNHTDIFVTDAQNVKTNRSHISD